MRTDLVLSSVFATPGCSGAEGVGCDADGTPLRVNNETIHLNNANIGVRTNIMMLDKLNEDDDDDGFFP